MKFPTTMILLCSWLLTAACPSTVDPTFCSAETSCDRPDELGDKDFCDIDKLYPGGHEKESCIARPAAEACNRVEPCEDSSKHCSDVSAGSKGSCVECRDGQDCGSGEICNASQDCETFTCDPGTAGNVACAGVDSSLPYCGDSGVCVGCLDLTHCPLETAGVCDQTSFQCRACATHPECGSGVCDLPSGICAEETSVLYVEKDAVGTDCTLASPCGSIMTAVGLVSTTRDAILVGTGDYAEQVVLNDVVVRVIGEDGANIGTATLQMDTNAVLVSGDSTVHFSNVNITPDGGGSGSVAMRCSSSGGAPTLTFTDGVISGAGAQGVVASSCDLTVTGSTISGNSGGGIDVDDSDYSIVNNFIISNGNTGAVSGFRAQGTTTKSEKLEFNTFAKNKRGGPTGYAVVCDVTNLVAANNIFMLPDASVASLNLGCAHEYSLFDTADTAAPTGNDNAAGIASFVNSAAGDYHLMPGSPGINVANPTATLPTDIDGDARPQGGRHDMGADEAE